VTDRVQHDTTPAFNAICVMFLSLSSWITSMIGVMNHVLELAVLVANLVVAFFTIRYLRRKTRKLDLLHRPTTLKDLPDGDH
jgi:apolipoprotein N-acyltransferase